MGVVSVIVISTLFPFFVTLHPSRHVHPISSAGKQTKKKKGRKKKKKTDIVQGRRGRNSNPQRSRRARDDGDPSFGSRNGRYSGRTARQQTLFGYPVSQACTFFFYLSIVVIFHFISLFSSRPQHSFVRFSCTLLLQRYFSSSLLFLSHPGCLPPPCDFVGMTNALTCIFSLPCADLQVLPRARRLDRRRRGWLGRFGKG